MRIVIDIDNDIYTRFSNNEDVDAMDMLRVCKAIRKGTPLPEGHGRLIDADAYAKIAPTIIEADGSESE